MILVTAFILCLIQIHSDFNIQDSRVKMHIHGTVKDSFTAENIKVFTVTAIDMDDASQVVQGTIDEKGKYTLPITDIKRYIVTINCSGYFPKASILNMHGPSDEEWIDGYTLQMDAALIPLSEGLETDPFTAPTGFVEFNDRSRTFDWDLEYTGLLRECQLEALKKHRNDLIKTGR